MECLFCKIANREIPSDIVFEDGQVVAFKDIHPQAPVHVLIIPRQHIATINDLTEQETMMIGNLVQTAKQLAQQFELASDGYRLLFNVNKYGGQMVYHIHLHLLGGRPMHWPPG